MPRHKHENYKGKEGCTEHLESYNRTGTFRYVPALVMADFLQRH
jgi:hypothetical protein